MPLPLGHVYGLFLLIPSTWPLRIIYHDRSRYRPRTLHRTQPAFNMLVIGFVAVTGSTRAV